MKTIGLTLLTTLLAGLIYLSFELNPRISNVNNALLKTLTALSYTQHDYNVDNPPIPLSYTNIATFTKAPPISEIIKCLNIPQTLNCGTLLAANTFYRCSIDSEKILSKTRLTIIHLSIEDHQKVLLIATSESPTIFSPFSITKIVKL